MFNKTNPARGGVGIFGIVLTVLSLIVSVALIGCDSDLLPDSQKQNRVSTRFRKSGTEISSSRSKVYTFEGMEEAGASVLKRSADQVFVSFSTSDLVPQHTYTLWWVVFDEPQNCTPEPDISTTPVCNEDDVFGPMRGAPDPVEVSVLWAGDGAVAPEWGRKNFRGLLTQFDSSNAIFGDGLNNPATAEIHLVLRSHGPAIPGIVRKQISTFNGGCNPGQPNEGHCLDRQFSIHKAG